MSQNKIQKLELTWVGKYDKREPLEPRILIEDSKYSYGDKSSGNMLIHGDNLLALKALEHDYAGKVKCIYIDPPYNTGSAFEQYDDGVEHSIWLSLMRDRLQLLYRLLSVDGSIWISIDDDEQAYLKILCDEIWGRNNFVANIVWQKKYGPANDAKWFSDSHDYIMVYSKDKNIWRPILLSRTKEQLKDYKNPDKDSRGVWRASDLSAKTPSNTCMYPIIGPTGKTFLPPPTRSWNCSENRYKELLSDNRIWFGISKTGRPMVKKFLSEVKNGITPETWWPREVGDDNKIAKYESKEIFSGKSFSTPKPEKLINRILKIASNKGDLVLDSFLGSGTTAAVAQKMGRKWIGIELGDHAYTHCYPRLKMVTDGTDQGGISKTVNWKGGSGFKFYELAPSLLKKDKFGNLIINKEYNADMLAAAMAKQEGYTYNPDKDSYWKQGNSSEQDYIYTTTQFITIESLDAIHNMMSDGESLLICCSACQTQCRNHYNNITTKKIPQMLLGRCEFDKDDYSLNIIDMPQMEEDDDEIIESELHTPEKNKNIKNEQKTLFD